MRSVEWCGTPFLDECKKPGDVEEDACRGCFIRRVAHDDGRKAGAAGERLRIAGLAEAEAESRRKCAAADRSCSQYGAERDHRMAAHALAEFAAKLRGEGTS